MRDLTRRQVIGAALASTLTALTPTPSPAQQPSSPPIKPRLTGVRRVIIDTDCPGNLGPDYQQQVTNALYLVDLAGRSGQVPVHAGMAHPILNRPYPVATFIHGKYGLGRVQAPIVRQKIESEHAVDTIRRLVRASPGEITILALGGLTNIAMALLREPTVARDLKGILFVGGRYATPGLPPGYNVLVDPEAAHVVFTSGVPLLLVGSDTISRDSILLDADFDHIATFNTPRSRFFIESNDLRRTFEKSHRNTTGSTNPDPLAVAAIIDPAIALTYASVSMRVELQGEYTRGLLVYGDDIYTGHPTPPPNVDICLRCDRDRFKQMIEATMRKT
jgi:purine nucleosidase